MDGPAREPNLCGWPSLGTKQPLATRAGLEELRDEPEMMWSQPRNEQENRHPSGGETFGDADQRRLFDNLAELVRRETGIALTAARKAQLLGKVRMRCEAVGCPDLRSYVQLLSSNAKGGGELEKLVSLATTNVTEFFRHPDQFDVFEKVVLPEVVSDKQTRRLLRIWSAGCATGEEVYSIAMILVDKLEGSRGWDVKILGTDLSRDALSVAERGRYPIGALKNVPRGYLLRFFRRAPEGDLMQLTEEIRRVTLFRRLNLMEPRYPLRRDVDVIFFRNVAIYFEPEIRRAVMFRISEHLRPGGFLVLGPAENLMDMRHCFEPLRANVFRKKRKKSR